MMDKRITYHACHHGDDVHLNEEELKSCRRKEWIEHHNNVKSYFKERPTDLLEFDIEVDGVEKIIDFFSDLNLNPSYWVQTNAGVL